MKTLLNMARAFNIGLLVATQRPDDRTLPAEIRDRFGMRACLHVGNEATSLDHSRRLQGGLAGLVC